MLETASSKTQQDIENWMTEQCNGLLKKWLVDLTFEEKEIWLWNAMVAMKRIELGKIAS